MNDEEIIESFNNEKDKSLKIQLKKISSLKQCVIIVLTGYIDTYNSTFFSKRIMTLVQNGYMQLIFDCSRLDYVSSTGIGAFTTFLKAVKEKNGDVSLVNLQPRVYEVFQLLGFSGFFHIKNSLEAAMQVFKRNDNDEPVLDIFSKVFSCPICMKKLKAPSAGRFRCVECKTIITVNKNGQVSVK